MVYIPIIFLLYAPQTEGMICGANFKGDSRVILSLPLLGFFDGCRQGPTGQRTMVPLGCSFMDLILVTPQPLPKVVVSFRAPKVVDGEVCALFSKEEIVNSTMPFRFSIFLKFLRQKPSLDAIRSFITSKWEINKQTVVLAISKSKFFFIRMSNEEDLIKALMREATDISCF